MGIPIQVISVPLESSVPGEKGILFGRSDASWLSDRTDLMGYGEKGYAYIIDGTGVCIAHHIRDFIMEQRNLLEEGKTNPEYARLSAMFQRMVRGETGFDEYPFMGSVRFFGYAPIPGTAWSIAVGAHKVDVFHQLSVMRNMIIFFSLILIVFSSLALAVFHNSTQNDSALGSLLFESLILYHSLVFFQYFCYITRIITLYSAASSSFQVRG